MPKQLWEETTFKVEDLVPIELRALECDPQYFRLAKRRTEAATADLFSKATLVARAVAFAKSR